MVWFWPGGITDFREFAIERATESINVLVFEVVGLIGKKWDKEVEFMALVWIHIGETEVSKLTENMFDNMPFFFLFFFPFSFLFSLFFFFFFFFLRHAGPRNSLVVSYKFSKLNPITNTKG